MHDADIAIMPAGDAVILWAIDDQIQVKKSLNNFQERSDIFVLSELGVTY